MLVIQLYFYTLFFWAYSASSVFKIFKRRLGHYAHRIQLYEWDLRIKTFKSLVTSLPNLSKSLCSKQIDKVWFYFS